MLSKQTMHFPMGLCIVSTYRSFAIKEPGIDTKSVPGIFFICWDISGSFGDVPLIYAYFVYL